MKKIFIFADVLESIKINVFIFQHKNILVKKNTDLSQFKSSQDIQHHYLQTLMKQGESCIWDTGDFLKKLKAVNEIPKGPILAIADLGGLYVSIPHNGGWRLRSASKTVHSIQGQNGCH